MSNSEIINRERVSRDIDGFPVFAQHNDSTAIETFDMTNWLEGETISSLGTAQVSGVTLDASSIETGAGGASTAVKLTITGTNGRVRIPVVTSGGRTRTFQVRVRDVGNPSRDNDYRYPA